MSGGYAVALEPKAKRGQAALYGLIISLSAYTVELMKLLILGGHKIRWPSSRHGSPGAGP